MFNLNLDRAKADAQPCAQSGNHCAQIGIFARFFNPRWPPCPQSLYSLAAFYMKSNGVGDPSLRWQN